MTLTLHRKVEKPATLLYMLDIIAPAKLGAYIYIINSFIKFISSW